MENELNETNNILQDVEDAALSAANETVGKVTTTLFNFFKEILTWNNFFKIIGVLLILLIITIVYNILQHTLKRILKNKIDQHQSMIITKVMSYIYYLALILYILSSFGVKLSAIWGAAGIAGVAIGFAAQTSVSNLISGMFVLGERTMKVGDFVTVGDVSGIVDSVGLLSIKIHTLDNQLIRIPNSTIINSNFQNNNFFNQRRMCFEVSIAYESNMQKALDALQNVFELCPTVLKDPEPKIWYDGFGESGINIVVAVWFNNVDLVTTKNDVYIAIKKVLDAAGIEIPYNKIDINMKKSI